MAKHEIYGIGPSIFMSNLSSASHRPLYMVPTEFGILNYDGTRTYFHGTGFTYDWVKGVFTGGTVTTIRHYDINGLPLDELTGLSVPTTSLEAVFFSLPQYYTDTNPLTPNLLSGDDVIDARARAGYAIVDDFIYGGDGNDIIYSGSGDDIVAGGNGNDRIYGGDGSDVLSGDNGIDRIYGGTGDDRLIGGDGDDYLYGEDGNDDIRGSAGNDYLSGGAGNDVIFDDRGSNIAYGGDGDDRIYLYTNTSGPISNNRVYGDGGNDEIVTGLGADNVHGGTGDDRIITDANNDTVFGDDGNDRIEAGDGADVLWGGNGTDILFGGKGNDYLSGDAGSDFLYGGAGNDRLLGGTGNDKLVGDDLNFALVGTSRDALSGGDGDDILWGRADNDTLNGGAGIDTATYVLSTLAELTIQKTATGFTVQSGYEGRDTLVDVEQIATRDGTFAWNGATSHWDKVSDVNAAAVLGLATLPTITSGTAGDDVMSWNNLTGAPSSGFSPDIYNALDGNDTITFAGVLSGGSVPPTAGRYEMTAVFGGNGNDVIKVDVPAIFTVSDRVSIGSFHFDGGAGNDVLTGGNSNDVLLGGAGDDVLRGNFGDDVLSGGSGADTFMFSRFTFAYGPNQYSGWGNDVITDFVVGVDRLNYSNVATSVVTDTTAGVLITSTLYSVDPSQAGGVADSIPTTTATVLLEGVHGNYTIADLTGLLA
jgi:Ca2+-binding RTX toxin-like protein